MVVSKSWVQGVALVLLFGFFVMGILAYRTYTASMPLPDRVVTESGDVLFTGDDITAGQKLFLNRGLMEYGPVLGHGAYPGPEHRRLAAPGHQPREPAVPQRGPAGMHARQS